MRLTPILLFLATLLSNSHAGFTIFNPIKLLRPRSATGGRLTADSDCLSWRLAVETHNIQDLKWVPDSCEDYVGKYMLGKQYSRDCQVVADEAIEYAKSITPAGDGKDVWVFDIDETTLSNLPYYSRPDVQFGALPKNEAKFNDWVALGVAPAVPSVQLLYTRVQSLGFKTVFLTGTAEKFREIMAVNLNRAGYYNWEKLILAPKEDNCSSSSLLEYKTAERTKLVKEGYRIVGNIGDQWSDILGKNAGNRTFKVPDPMYYLA